MSRSYKKVPIFGMAGTSDKWSKQKAHRVLRNKVNMVLHQMLTDYDYYKIIPRLKDVSNVWSFSKDGKFYWKNATKKDMTK